MPGPLLQRRCALLEHGLGRVHSSTLLRKRRRLGRKAHWLRDAGYVCRPRVAAPRGAQEKRKKDSQVCLVGQGERRPCAGPVQAVRSRVVRLAALVRRVAVGVAVGARRVVARAAVHAAVHLSNARAVVRRLRSDQGKPFRSPILRTQPWQRATESCAKTPCTTRARPVVRGGGGRDWRG